MLRISCRINKQPATPRLREDIYGVRKTLVPTHSSSPSDLICDHHPRDHGPCKRLAMLRTGVVAWCVVVAGPTSCGLEPVIVPRAATSSEPDQVSAGQNVHPAH